MGRPRTNDYTPGLRVGTRVILGPAPASHPHRVRYRCDCGAEGTAIAYAFLKSGKCKRCAVRSRFGSDEVFPDNALRRRWLKRWYGIKQRIFNAGNAKYRRYGGRGITMDPAWAADSAVFLAYIATLPYHERAVAEPFKYTIDRINNDGNYEPGNIRLVDVAANNRNKVDFRARLRSAGLWSPGEVRRGQRYSAQLRKLDEERQDHREAAPPDARLARPPVLRPH